MILAERKILTLHAITRPTACKVISLYEMVPTTATISAPYIDFRAIGTASSQVA
jgi:hypothetical protein